MKKSICLLLCIILSANIIGIYAFAENKNQATVNNPQVFYFDKTADSPIGNLIGVSVSIKNISKYKMASVYIDYNKDVIDVFEYSVPDNLIGEQVLETDTGIEFCGSFPDKYYDRNNEKYSKMPASCVLYFNVKAMGEHGIKIYGTYVDMNGKKGELEVAYNECYEDVVDKEVLDFVQLKNEYKKNYYAVFDYGTTVSDVLTFVDAESVFIKELNGNTLSANDKVSTASRIVTEYKGYEVDSLPICIMYDIDCNGKLTAADARLTLRYCANIQNINEMALYAANVDGKNGITAADARHILRKSAGLE
ncbi:MAG: hypothetical protein IKW03_09500 [Clostridia bacterium]|nr:hypothetical protein [Clostridia bacterium]